MKPKGRLKKGKTRIKKDRYYLLYFRNNIFLCKGINDTGYVENIYLLKYDIMRYPIQLVEYFHNDSAWTKSSNLSINWEIFELSESEILDHIVPEMI